MVGSESVSCSVVSDFLRSHGLEPARLLCPWGFSRQKYWNELPCPLPGDLPDTGIETVSLTSPALPGGFFTTSTTWKAHLAFRMQFKCYLFFEVSMTLSLIKLTALLLSFPEHVCKTDPVF